VSNKQFQNCATSNANGSGSPLSFTPANSLATSSGVTGSFVLATYAFRYGFRRRLCVDECSIIGHEQQSGGIVVKVTDRLDVAIGELLRE